MNRKHIMKLDENNVIQHVCDSCKATVDIVYATMDVDYTLYHICIACYDKKKKEDPCKVCTLKEDNNKAICRGCQYE